MINSILQYLSNGLLNLEKESEKFYENPKDFTDFILKVKDNVLRLGIEIIGENFETMDQNIRESNNRKKEWVIVRRDETSLLTSLGQVNYHKTLFKHKKTGERCYLIDRLMELEPHERITPDAVAQIYEEAVESSYRRGGEKASLLDGVSKQTVKNKIHKIEFPREPQIEVERKKVRNLYVGADEDHVALQFFNKKGDLTLNENEHKQNNCLSKLIYVYEDRVNENIKSKRKKLVGTKYFSGVYEGTEANLALWRSINEYINVHYEIEEGGHIFLGGDGGRWIETGKSILGKQAIMILDEFHILKYVQAATSHMGDSKDDSKDALFKAIRSANKDEIFRLFDIFIDFARDEKDIKRICQSKEYLINNWVKIRNRKKYANEIHGCSAEGHVSHILSDRLSSRPMGWSKQGVHKMSQLRAYEANGGDMLELAKYQRNVIPFDLQERKKVYSGQDIITSEKKARLQIERYYDKFEKTVAHEKARKYVTMEFKFSSMRQI